MGGSLSPNNQNDNAFKVAMQKKAIGQLNDFESSYFTAT
jgi:hypothetical protein